MQKINLYNKALIQPKEWITLNRIAILSVTIIVLMIGYYVMLNSQANGLTIQRDAANIKLTESDLKVANLIAKSETDGDALKKEAAILEQALRLKTSTLNALSSQFKPANGYTSFMSALANHKIAGLWLTGFSVDGNSQTITISGKSLLADFVPQYIAALSADADFKDRAFTVVKINKSTADLVDRSLITNTTTEFTLMSTLIKSNGGRSK